MAGGNKQVDPSQEHVLTAYDIEGYESGDTAPAELGPVVRFVLGCKSLSGTDSNINVLVSAEDAPGFAKSLLAVLVDMGIDLQN